MEQKSVLIGMSGGVDSSVAAVLLSKAVGKQLTCGSFKGAGIPRNRCDYASLDVFGQL